MMVEGLESKSFVLLANIAIAGSDISSSWIKLHYMASFSIGVYAGGKAEYTGHRSFEVYADYQKGNVTSNGNLIWDFTILRIRD